MVKLFPSGGISDNMLPAMLWAFDRCFSVVNETIHDENIGYDQATACGYDTVVFPHAYLVDSPAAKPLARPSRRSGKDADFVPILSYPAGASGSTGYDRSWCTRSRSRTPGVREGHKDAPRN